MIHSISMPEPYVFDMKRPMRSLAMEPNFGKRGMQAFKCGGLRWKIEDERAGMDWSQRDSVAFRRRRQAGERQGDEQES